MGGGPTYAIEQGYSIFFYDRLGTGKSSKISGFVNQAAIQVQILDQIAKQIRAGKYTGAIGIPNNIIFLAHSYGSAISMATIVGAPDIADAAVLTGFGFAQNFQVITQAMALRIAAVEDSKWNYLDLGYLTWTDFFAYINCFFKLPTYSWDAVQFADSIRAPIAIMELLSVPSFNFNATAFQGPVLIQNGEYDFLVCDGYCPGVNDEPAQSYFAGSRAFNATIVPKTGHSLNFHDNAYIGYYDIFRWLSQNDL